MSLSPLVLATQPSITERQKRHRERRNATVEAKIRLEEVTAIATMEAKKARDETPLFEDLASPSRRVQHERRSSTVVPVWRMDPTTPLYEGRVRCSLSHSLMRPPRERPHSRMIWAGPMTGEGTVPKPTSYDSQTLRKSTSLPAIDERTYHTQSTQVHDRWRETVAAYRHSPRSLRVLC